MAEDLAAEGLVRAGLAGMIGLGRERRIAKKWPIGRCSRLDPVFVVNEIAVQYVVVAAHQPQGDPVADRQHNNANNANLKHLGANA